MSVSTIRTGAPLAPLNVVHNAYTPKEAVEISSRAGAAKARMRPDKVIISSFLGGAFLAFAGACNIVVQASPWAQTNIPGIVKMLGSIIFPFGLVVIVLTGTDLATGSFMYTTLSTIHRRTTVWQMLQHWTLTFFGNLAGSLFVVGLILGHGGVLDNSIVKAQAIAMANTKAVAPEWHQIFLRAIGANWLVCLACFLASMAREFFSKVMAIWFPVFCFVLLGLDHVIANMLYIPIAIFLKDPKITVGYYIWKSMIPSLIGNIVGGALFVAIVFWYLYLLGDTNPVTIDGDNFNLERAPLVDEAHGGISFGRSRMPSSMNSDGEQTITKRPKEASEMV